MPRTLLSLVAAPLLLVVSPTSHSYPDQRGSPSIQAVQAFLYYHDRGSFSANVVDNPSFTFWNVIIGEGSAEGPSQATLVAVTVVNLPEPVPVNAAVHLTARTEREAILDRSESIGVPRGTNRLFIAAFWLYGTGCFPIVLSARLVGFASARAVTKRIPFACGE